MTSESVTNTQQKIKPILSNQTIKETIKLIASDIDGTLLDSTHQLPPQTQTALSLLSTTQPSLKIMLATGKTIFGCSNILNKLDFLNESYGAFLNGAIILKRSIPTDQSLKTHSSIPGYIIIKEYPISPPSVLFFINYCLERNIIVTVYSYNEVFTPNIDDPCSFLIDLTRFHEPLATYKHDLIEMIKSECIPIHKVMILHDPNEIQGVDVDIRSTVGFPVDVSFFPTQPEMLEVVCSVVSKSMALQHVCELEGIGMCDVMAFGDGTNDFEMIRDVGVGIRMGNAVDILKTVTDYETKSNDDCGVAVFLNAVYSLY